MPLGDHNPKISLDEWYEYRERRKRHLRDVPNYDAEWNRPDAGTADTIWDLLLPTHGVPIDALLPSVPSAHDLPPHEREELETTVKQAFYLLLDGIVSAGRGGPAGGTFRFTQAFDLLGARWSDHYRLAREQGRAFRVLDMTRATATAVRRDLLRNGLRLEALWRLAIRDDWSGRGGRNPLFWLRRIPNAEYQVTLKHGTPELAQFEELVGPTPPAHGWHLRLTGDPLLHESPRLPEICEERPYNEILLGPRSTGLLEALGRGQLLFNVDAFDRDYQRANRKTERIGAWLERRFQLDATLSDTRSQSSGAYDPRDFASDSAAARAAAGRGWWRALSERERAMWNAAWRTWGKPAPKAGLDRLKRLLTAYDHAREFTRSFGAVEERLRALRSDRPAHEAHAPHLPIRTTYFRDINRRWHAADFWPLHVSGNLDARRPAAGPLVSAVRTSQRERWFSCHPGPGDIGGMQSKRPLGGLDVSSSQAQIVAVFLGLEDLERDAGSEAKPFKRLLAEIAWEEHCRDRERPLLHGYDSPEDEDLVALVKELWMTGLYGADVKRRGFEQNAERRNRGWYGEIARNEPQDNALRFFTTVLNRYPGVKDFLDASREIAKRAYAVDSYMGVLFTDPFDEAPVRWNPARRKKASLAIGHYRVALSLSTKAPKYSGPYAGDHLVDAGELGRKVAPSLIHMLDAFFNGLVMERLIALGVRDFVALHDCWLVPLIVELEPAQAREIVPAQLADILRTNAGSVIMNGSQVLAAVINDVGEAWLRGLERTYDEVIAHLTGSRFESKARQWRERWEARVQNRRWPRFMTKESELVRVENPEGAMAAYETHMARTEPDMVRVRPGVHIHRNRLKGPAKATPDAETSPGP
jgi:hypothetical protein